MFTELDVGLYIPESEILEVRRNTRSSARFHWTVHTRSGDKYPCNDMTQTQIVQNNSRIHGLALARYEDGTEEITRVTVIAWRITMPALDRVPNRAQWADPIFAGDIRDKTVAVCLHDPDTGQYWDPGMWWANDWGKALERMRKATLS